MPAAHPVEFRRRAVALARAKEKPVGQLAANLEISESCLRRWMKIADIDEGVQEGLTSDERAELVRSRRENRVHAAEIEVLRQASAYFAREVVGPKGSSPVIDRLVATRINAALACRVLRVSRSGYYAGRRQHGRWSTRC